MTLRWRAFPIPRAWGAPRARASRLQAEGSGASSQAQPRERTSRAEQSVPTGPTAGRPRSMPITGIVPDWLFSIVAVATVFTVMFDIGLAIVPGDFRSIGRHPSLMLKGLFSVL